VPRQFHNQPEESHQHRFLVDLWAETGLGVSVHASNGGVTGSDPRVLGMLIDGELEFATLMGPLIAGHVPAAEIQGVPFAFRDSAQAHAAMDHLADHLRAEMRARGLHWLGVFENGMRHVCSVTKEIRHPADLAGYRLRVPAAQIYAELFDALGAVAVPVNIDGLYGALRDGTVDGHENPLAITEVNRLYEVTRSVSLTAHAWSGFNLVANLRYWQSLPEPTRAAIERAAKTHVARQRAYTVALNADLETRLVQRGMSVMQADRMAFRRAVPAGRYSRWRQRCGTTAWRLLEEVVGKLH
jgi:TRAP-type transport system periplasmic protein